MLLIDRREPKKLKDALLDLGEEIELKHGDYFFMSSDELSICIERKTIGDMLSSMVGHDSDGRPRLYHQLQELTQFDVPILLLEGIYSPTHDGYLAMPSFSLRWRYTSVENLILSTQLRGICIARTSSSEATARLIRGYHDFFAKEGSHFQIGKQRLFSYSAKITPQLRLVCSLPGIDWQLGHRLLDYFGSPLNLFNADERLLTGVEGIGRKKAKAIYQALRLDTGKGDEENKDSLV